MPETRQAFARLFCEKRGISPNARDSRQHGEESRRHERARERIQRRARPRSNFTGPTPGELDSNPVERAGCAPGTEAPRSRIRRLRDLSETGHLRHLVSETGSAAARACTGSQHLRTSPHYAVLQPVVQIVSDRGHHTPVGVQRCRPLLDQRADFARWLPADAPPTGPPCARALGCAVKIFSTNPRSDSVSP